MLKKLVNEAHFTLRITTTGPVLIRSGGATISGPDMTPVLTFHNGRQEVFLPGSSLKGVFRSHSEKVVCGLKSRVVCYPFSGSEDREVDLSKRRQDYRDSCGAIFIQLGREQERTRVDEDTEFVYKNSCPTCRLFGSTSFIGRVAINDAYLVSQATTEQRDGVGIDRLTGGASHGAKFELEVVSTGVSFETDVHVRNFEIWQLGMLFVVVQDMADELIRIGSGRSRGLGQVTVEIIEQERHGRPGGFVTSSLRAKDEPDNELWGLGRWLNDSSYGTRTDDKVTLPPVERSTRGIRSMRTFTGEALDTLRGAAITEFVRRMQEWPEPKMPMFLRNR